MDEKDIENRLSKFDKQLLNIGEIIAIVSIIFGLLFSSVKLYFNLENRIAILEYKMQKLEKQLHLLQDNEQ